MTRTDGVPAAGWRELLLVVLASVLLTTLMTYPVAFKLGSVGRVDLPDGQFSIWNVSWVARTLVVDPRHVFDANIFYPHHDTLAYSESNLGAGALAIPVYWATRNPYAALNSVVLLAFTFSAIGAYYLVRYVTHDRAAAAISAIVYAFCPYVFAHTAHIQLLMTAGLPFSLLAFHRVADRPTPGRGAALGALMAAQAICCGYYGVFDVLIIGFAVIVVATIRGGWTNRQFWSALVIGAVVSMLLVAPAFAPYLGQGAGFRRELSMAASFSANWSDYLASSSHAHAWMLAYLPRWVEVSFPGFVSLVLAATGVGVAWRERRTEVLTLYGGLALLACWASFGPRAGLYSVLYQVVPVFAWLRAPARFGLIVDLSFAVLAGIGAAWLLRRMPRRTVVAGAIAALAVAELNVELNMPAAKPVEHVYQVLAPLPPGPVIEMPFFYLPEMFVRHSYYMLASTTHWMPLVNGYSDYMPPDFLDHVMTLAPFPSRDSLKLLGSNGVRYAVFHMYWYNDENTHDVLTRLKEFEPYLRPLYIDSDTRLYEIVGVPP